ncbi:MAG: hypothetical protein FJW26_00095 [Acidimicrobiia bacterium]|nr:hypothetical protein [Acidimicrobiia bacterium]
MAEDDNTHFDLLTKDLSPEQRSEFFQVLHTAGISRQDVELAKLLRALQLYRALYDEIPARVWQAVKQADALHRTFRSLHESAAIRWDEVLSQLERNMTAAFTITNEFREARSVVVTAIQKSKTDVAQTLEATLRKSLSSGLLTPFETFVNDIKDRCGRTAIEAQQISLHLRQARRIHIGGYALAAMVLTVVLTVVIWISGARHYAEREHQLIQQIDQNRLVLAELARKGATLKVKRSPKDANQLYLIIEHATAWTADQDAVVELK